MRVTVARALGCIAAAGALAVVGAAAAAPAGASPATGAVPVPAKFQPVSTSFIDSSWGVVLGATGCKGVSACPAKLVVTTNGGSHWKYLAAPAAKLGNSPRQVNQVVFANRRDGYLYGQYGSKLLWQTSNGGSSWQSVGVSSPVNALAIAGNRAFLLAGTHLLKSTVGSLSWKPVPGVTGSVLATSGSSVWLGGGKAGLWVEHGTGAWHSHAFKCPKLKVSYGLAGISAASASQVAFFCAAFQGMFHTNKLVLTSVNGGQTTKTAGRQAPDEGDPAGFAVPPGKPSVFVIAVVTPGQSYLARSANSGKSWSEFTAPHTTGGTNLSSLAFVSPTTGVVVVGGPGQLGPDALFATTNTGRSWHYLKF
jgi:hypothetical protein